MKIYKLEQKKIYRKTEQIPDIMKPEGVLEKIASSYTKMPENMSKEYNIDNCGCPSCGCVRGGLIIVLSPAGVATAVTAFAGMSAIK